MTNAYRMKVVSDLEERAVVGTVVYRASQHDYGLAADDTRITGIEHVSVSLERNGRYPTFTVPLRDLEPIETASDEQSDA